MSLTLLRKAVSKLILPFKKGKTEKSQDDMLEKISSLYCDSSTLDEVSQAQLDQWFTLPESTHLWNFVREGIEALMLPEMTGGVNPGDQKALFYLINAFKPKTVLEVGTHIGCSTVHIASALKQLSEKYFTTVDIRDVNDPVQKPWVEACSPASPKDLITCLDCQEFTHFKVSTSLDFFRESPQTFDFIFLDGLHDAHMVYQEIPVALQHLNPGGHILLHDYFPNGQPLWQGYPPIVGPYLAVKRLQEEGANLKALPLGNLPWPTKLGTNLTSLALLSRN